MYSSEISHSVQWPLYTDVSWQFIGSIFKYSKGPYPKKAGIICIQAETFKSRFMDDLWMLATNRFLFNGEQAMMNDLNVLASVIPWAISM
jgi:hypothetical protein